MVEASTSLTMGYHHGPSADLLVLVCVSAFVFVITNTPLRIFFSQSCHNPLYKGGLM